MMTSMIPACVYEVRPELFLAIATVILAFVTAAIKALEFEQMPILGFRDLKIHRGAIEGDQPGLPFISVGIV